MTTDPTPPTPETLLADAWASVWPEDIPMGAPEANADALLAHAPLREALTRGLALTPERVAALAKMASNLDVIALTLADHPEYPRKDVDIDAARALARFTASDLRAILAALSEV